MRLSFIYCLLFLLACKTDSSQPDTAIKSYLKISGATMGTRYNIQCDLNYPSLKTEIDSILIAINGDVSTYENASHISKLNKNELDVKTRSENRILFYGPLKKHFDSNFVKSKKIHLLTDGYFDPTVMPLVNYWGFGYTPKQKVTNVDSSKIASMLNYVGFDKWEYSREDENVEIEKPMNAEIDFSAIAKGYAVDYLSDYLESIGAENYMVEIGGEVKTKGQNTNGKEWTIGLNSPEEDASLTDFALLVQFSNKALASSGNYRNFYISNGKKYVHEINPMTGYPEQNDVLGASVIADNCADADAFATAFMIMGLEKAKKKVEQLEGVEACLFYSNDEGNIQYVLSSGFDAFLKS